jgi:hypothetical protein
LGTEIINTPQTDYAFRIVVDQSALDRVFEVLSASIDYPEFKRCVLSLAQQRSKLPAYQDFWSGLRRLQDEGLLSVDDSSHSQPGAQFVKTHGGHLARTLETLNGFKDKYGHWPTILRLNSSACEALRDKHLTSKGFEVLQSRLHLIVSETEKLMAEDPAGLTFDYVKEGWTGKSPPSAADEWLWNVKL